MKRPLENLARVFAMADIVDGEQVCLCVYAVVSSCGAFFIPRLRRCRCLQWSGVVDLKTMSFVQDALSTVLKELRPDAVSLVDAFDISDRVRCDLCCADLLDN